VLETGAGVVPRDQFKVNKCSTFSSEVCDLPYNSTIFPNSCTGSETDAEADMTLRTYDDLLRIKCHPHIKSFLCWIYYPYCQGDFTVYPCRDFCLDVKNKCIGFLEALGAEWSETLNCSKFPNKGPCYRMPPSNNSCKVCEVETRKKAVTSLMCKSPSRWSLYAVIRVLERKVHSKRVAYTVVLEHSYKPRVITGAGATPPTVTLITESTTDCPCVSMKVGKKYFVGGIFIPVKGYYVIPNDAAILKWKPTSNLPSKIEKCLNKVKQSP
jgi:hypothetical protein